METEIGFLDYIKAINFNVVETIKDKSLAREIYLGYMQATRRYSKAVKDQNNLDIVEPNDFEFNNIVDAMFEEMWKEVHND